MLCASVVAQSISERLLYVNASLSQMSVCKNFLRPIVFCARDFSLTVRAFWRAEQLRWVETNFKEMRKVDQCSDEMKTVEKNLLTVDYMWEEMGWDEKSWDEKSSHDLRWDEVSSAKCKCEVQVWTVKSAVWSVRSCSWTTSAQQLRTKHARTGLAGARRMQVLEVVLGSDSWKLRWHMRRDEIRRDELG